ELERVFRVAARARREQKGVQSVSVQGSLDGMAAAIALATAPTDHRSPPSVSLQKNKNVTGGARGRTTPYARRSERNARAIRMPSCALHTFGRCRSRESVSRSSAAGRWRRR